jgi:hypothetical protein
MSLLFGHFKKVVEKCQQLFVEQTGASVLPKCKHLGVTLGLSLFAKFGYFLFFAILFDNF